MFKWRPAAAVATMTALALAGCSGAGASGDQSTLTWGVIVPATTFQAESASWANESPYIQAVYDTLLRAAPDGEIQPSLALDWEYNDDSTVLTLTLRDDVMFIDDTQMTAEDAAASLLAFKAGGSPNASNLASLGDAVALDDTTLELSLTAPDPAMLNYLTQNSGIVAPASSVGDESTATDPVGSGPYVLNTSETVVGSSYVFDRNENYWNPEEQHYDRLVLAYYADPTSLLNAVQGGQVNVTNIIDAGTVPQMESSGFTANEFELDWWGFMLNDREGVLAPALAEVGVRQAINYALDREALVQTIGNGYGTPTSQIFPTFSPSFDPALDDFYSYDLDRARALMAESGYGDGFEVSMPRAGGIPEAHWALYADQLAQIGITVNYTEEQPSEFVPSIIGGNYPMNWFALQQDPTDWQLTQFQIAQASTWNPLSQSTPEVEALITTIQLGSEDEAVAAGRQLNRFLVENAWYAPMYRVTSVFMSDANTSVATQVGNAVPYLSSVRPA